MGLLGHGVPWLKVVEEEIWDLTFLPLLPFHHHHFTTTYPAIHPLTAPYPAVEDQKGEIAPKQIKITSSAILALLNRRYKLNR